MSELFCRPSMVHHQKEPDNLKNRQFRIMNSIPKRKTATSERSHQYQVVAFWILVAANLVVWLKYLPDSFWLDECGTRWLIEGGFSDLIRRSLLLLHGPLFASIMAATALIGGTSELAMRLPSWIAIGVSFYFFYLLSSDLLKPDAARTALAFFTLWPIVSMAAVDARPYSFAMAALCGSLVCFLRANRDGRCLHFAGFCFGLVCLVYLQLLFIYVLAIPVLYLIFAGRDSLSKHRYSWLVSAITILLALLPLAYHYKVMFSWGSSYSWAPRPDFDAVLAAIAPLKIVYLFAVSAIVCAIGVRGIKLALTGEDKHSLMFCMVLILFPVLFLFGVSQFTATRIFSTRYLMPATPGLALLWAWLLGRIEPGHICLKISIGALALSLLAHTAFDSGHQSIEDWRGTLTRANQMEKDSDGVLVLYSAFVESASLSVLKNPDQRAFLLAPLVAYPIRHKDVVVLPMEPRDAARDYSEEELRAKVWKRDRFTVVLRQNAHHAAWQKFLLTEAHQRGYLLANEELFRAEIPILLLHFNRSR
ncbi:MAG: glycosyltransferase family 39 protein [Acidobacteria bacterium]|nr:glycosyltransferase family 39 protein [Acidobacteriota bacterium]